MRYWIDFKKLREELSFEKLLEQYNVKLHRKGEQATGPCPLPAHSGDRKTDSFSANVVKGIFQCFSCQAKGNVLDFAVLMAGKNPESGNDLRQTAIDLAKRYSLQHVGSEQKSRKSENGVSHVKGQRPERNENPVPAEKPPIVNSTLPFTLQHLDREHTYLLGRGFTAETVKHFDLGFCSKGRLSGRIAIPIHDPKGNLIAYAGRVVDDAKVTPDNPRYLFPGTRISGGETFEFRKSLILYNAHRIQRPVESLIVVEGFASVWWLTQCGFPNCVALMGSSVSDDQAKQICGLVSGSCQITAFTDADAPGNRCFDEIVSKLDGGINICRATIDGCVQPTDFNKEQLSQVLIAKGPASSSDSSPTKEERICDLIRQFPCLANFKIEPKDWNAEDFERRSLKFSSGERTAAQFVLSVWNPQTAWECGRFTLNEAASRLDAANKKPITAWLEAPWWP